MILFDTDKPSLTYCPTCRAMTPVGKMVCPYCPSHVRRMQYVGAFAAYGVAFGVPLAVAALIVWVSWP